MWAGSLGARDRRYSKGTIRFSPNFDFLFRFDVLVQKPSRMVWEGPRSLSTKTKLFFVIHLFIFVLYVYHYCVLGTWPGAPQEGDMLQQAQIETTLYICLPVCICWTVFGWKCVFGYNRMLDGIRVVG